MHKTKSMYLIPLSDGLCEGDSEDGVTVQDFRHTVENRRHLSSENTVDSF